MDDLTSLGDALEDKIESNSKISKKIEASEVVETAEEILADMFGKIQQRHLEVEAFKSQDTLQVYCKSSAMAQEIDLKQDKIINKINEKIDRDLIEKIIFS